MTNPNSYRKFVYEYSLHDAPDVRKWGMTQTQYWIQERNEAGNNWFDSVGLSPETTVAEAVKQTKSWAKSFPKRTVRLAVRAQDSVIFEA